MVFIMKVKVKEAQSCPTLFDPMDCSPWNSPGQNTFPSPGDLPNPQMVPRSPALQVDSLPAKPQGKPWASNPRSATYKVFGLVSGKPSWRRQWHPTPVLLPGNPMDGGAWWAAVHGVAQSRT